MLVALSSPRPLRARLLQTHVFCTLCIAGLRNVMRRTPGITAVRTVRQQGREERMPYSLSTQLNVHCCFKRDSRRATKSPGTT